MSQLTGATDQASDREITVKDNQKKRHLRSISAIDIREPRPRGGTFLMFLRRGTPQL